MVSRQLILIVIGGMLWWQLAMAADPGEPDGSSDTFIVINYHEVLDDQHHERGLAALSIDTGELVAQFSWLREHNYHPVSLEDIVQASQDKRRLPPHAVLLTFDDGFRSVYTQVFPLLQLYQYPAVVALVGSWLEEDDSGMVNYGDTKVSRSNFITWAQAREMVNSGLVEIASHSYKLHHGIEDHPQHNSLPAATTRIYNQSTGYESATAYLQRIHNDLYANSQLIERHIGRKPRSMVWPYGKYNEATIRIARELGMPITMSLDEGVNNLKDLSLIKRILVPAHTQLPDFIALLQQPRTPAPIRVAHVDLDSIYDPDYGQQEKNLGVLLDRIKAMEINTVYLQAFADPDGDGTADALYFPNRHLPMRADLFSRAAWQLQTRANVRVYAWLPVFSFELSKIKDSTVPYVEREAETSGSSAIDYHRVSPFSEQARKIVGEIYEDLGIHADFTGLLFHDDAYLNDFEDASDVALEYYTLKWNMPDSIDEIRNQPEIFKAWTQQKTRALIEWTDYLAERVRFSRPTIKTARNLYASVVLDPHAEEWFAQSLPMFLEHYDYTAVMAMPYMEGVHKPEQWLTKLVDRIAHYPGALNKTVFELQAVDWRKQQPLDSKIIASHMDVLQRHGAYNFGYYPEDFIAGHPLMAEIRPVISLSTYPYTR